MRAASTTSKPVVTSRRNQRGFTLLEVLVATAIMGIAIAGVMSGLAQASRNAELLTEYDLATYLARQRMDELLADHTLPRGAPLQGVFVPAQTGGIEMGWTARVDPYETFGPGRAAAGGPVVDRIALEIWWNDGIRRRSFSLEAFRRGTLRAQDSGLPVILNSGGAPSP